jgi:hypothetical protein
VAGVGGVFINYRGADSDTAAVLIDRELTARFGSDQVFLDSRSIPAGTDFVEELLRRLRTCSVLVVVIGPRWLTLTDAAGRRRIDDPQDWIRREIYEAFTHGLRVVPVLTDDVALPVEGDLPAELAGLSRRQYLPLRRRYTTVDLAYLVERITETDPELAKIAAHRQTPGRVPQQLPAAVAHFAGRHGLAARRARLARAKKVLDDDWVEQCADHDAVLRERGERIRVTGKGIPGTKPKPPVRDPTPRSTSPTRTAGP